MKEFKIKDVEIKTPLVLAPLAGITNLPFREICKTTGCGLVCSEMISSNGLIYNSGKTFSMLASSELDSPLSIQIFGYDPKIMADAAKIIEEEAKPDIIDINMGCSVRKILKSNSGSALMKDPQGTKEILKEVRKAIKIPLTIKIRTGWDNSGDQAMVMAKIAQDEGVDAIAFHPRTAKQGFSGKADWSLIEKLKKEVSIPVIGNGDITHASQVIDMFEQTGCDAVMIGRGAISNPFIFQSAKNLIQGKEEKPVTMQEHFNLMRFYMESTIKYLNEEIACKMMRSRLAWFVKGLPHNGEFKEKIKNIETRDQALIVIEEYEKLLMEKSQAE